MKNILCLALLQLALSFTFVLISQNSALELQGRGANLIETTCERTPFYKLCVSTLQSDPRSSSADVAGLAHIAADKLKAKAAATLGQIDPSNYIYINLSPNNYLQITKLKMIGLCACSICDSKQLKKKKTSVQLQS